ncbi:hypothetical protein [Salmonella phage GSP003]|nr:hypothetical protein [Salmonella phage GSP003]
MREAFERWAVVEGLPVNKGLKKDYLVYEVLNNAVQHDYYIVPDDGRKPFWNHYDKYVTHGMPVPAAPEV